MSDDRAYLLADMRPSPRWCVGMVRPSDSHHCRSASAFSPSGFICTLLRITVDRDTPAEEQADI